MPEGTEELLLQREVEAFLFREAELLDAGMFDAWLELFADDATYWVPCGDGHPGESVSIVHAGLSELRERVWRLGSGVAHAQEPPSKTVRLVGNVSANADGSDIGATSAFVVCEFRRGRQRMHAGRCRHALRRTPGGLRIVLKRADLVDSEGYLGNLSILL